MVKCILRAILQWQRSHGKGVGSVLEATHCGRRYTPPETQKIGPENQLQGIVFKAKPLVTYGFNFVGQVRTGD